MLLNRKAMRELLHWKNSPARKSLIISGARQIGKTTLVRCFAQESYASVIELNFLEDSSLKDIFSGPLDAQTIFTNIRLFRPHTKIIPNETLLFLDEVQECPDAITALKFLSQDPRFDVIATGSALGMAYKQVTSFPVGFVEYLDMYAMDFEEFLWALHVDDAVLSLIWTAFESRTPVSPAIHERMMTYLRQYMVVGGMPEVVASFSEAGDYAAADVIQRQIYRAYISDIARYAPPQIQIKAEKCYTSIPLQLTKENHKYQYKTVEERGTARKFETSIDWLINAHIAIPVNNVSAIEFPLKAYAKEDNFRLYMSDIGLLICTYPYEIKKALLEDRVQKAESSGFMLRVAKGGLYESLAADILTKQGIPLYFFRNETGSVEIEFLIENRDGIIPIEIKAGRSSTASLNRVLEQDTIPYGYKFASQNVGVSGKKITLPLYMLMFLSNGYKQATNPVTPH